MKLGNRLRPTAENHGQLGKHSVSKPLIYLSYTLLLLLSQIGTTKSEEPGETELSNDELITHCDDSQCGHLTLSENSELEVASPSSSQYAESKDVFQNPSEHSEIGVFPDPEDLKIPKTNQHEPEIHANSEKEVEGHSSRYNQVEDHKEIIFNCIFSSIPYVGGKWLTKMIRKRISDDTLLEASNSFLDGGRFMLRFIDAGSKSTAVMWFDRLSDCFDEDTYEKDYNSSAAWENISAFSENPEKGKYHDHRFLASTVLRNHRRRRLSRSAKKDSLVGFSILGILIVGAMIAYLIYLLT